MVAMIAQILGQLDKYARSDGSPLIPSNVPPLTVEASTAMTWMIAGVAAVGVLLVTFKISKRSYLEKD